MLHENFIKINDYLWEAPKSLRNEMRVPARVYISEDMKKNTEEEAFQQLINLTTLPGIVKYSLAMPDIHTGYASPIGGVAALDAKEGVISPGLCGYDINCLCPNTKVLLSDGCYFDIKLMKNYWKKKKINFVDFNKKALSSSSIIYFLKKYNTSNIYHCSLFSGKKIQVSRDHPIRTKRGMKEAKFLKKGDLVLVYPFEGVPFVKPLNRTIFSEQDFKRILIKLLGTEVKENIYSSILNDIKKRKILPLKYDSFQLPCLLKIIGFIFGDGYISIDKHKRVIIGFNGKPEDLKIIKQDLEKIGFSTSLIFQRKRKHKIKTHYREYEFESLESSFRVTSFDLAALLVGLGVPFGVKTFQEYRVPNWIFKCSLWQKRLFLASLFGAELSNPKTLNRYNFYLLELNMSKSSLLKDNGRLFLEDIKKLLNQFQIKTAPIKEVLGYKHQGKLGLTIGLRLSILGNDKNLIKFFESVGYEYNLEKQKAACLAANYLRRKLAAIKIRNNARKEIKKLYRQKGDFKKFAPQLLKKYSNKYITYQFLYHSLFKENSHGVIKKRGTARIALNFVPFEEFKEQYAYGEQGLVWDEVVRIKANFYHGFVYDLTIDNINHNFIANNFVVSNCGMRLLKSNYTLEEIRPHLDKIASKIQREIPSGLGKGRGQSMKFSLTDIDKILAGGAQWLVEQGYGEKEDLDNCEANGRLEWAQVKAVSLLAKQRGQDQVGTLGSGNHFLEIQKVAEIFDEETAKIFGLFPNQVVIMIHTGSRGLGHQVCTDYLKLMVKAMNRYGIKVPDRELACVPFTSQEGQDYFGAMAGAANFAWANRQLITYFIKKVWKETFGQQAQLTSLYDVAHNIIKREKYSIGGEEKELLVHRKGATRAFPPNHLEISEKYKLSGQPVLIPGSMGTSSYILKGVATGEQSFYSTCHGSGRIMSRHAAIRVLDPYEIVNNMRKKGIIVKVWSLKGLTEEAPQAYKNIDEVVGVVHKAGLSLKVAKLIPLAVIKGE